MKGRVGNLYPSESDYDLKPGKISRFLPYEHSKLNHLSLLFLIAYTLALSIGAAANIWINYLGKGSTWDIYPVAESSWVLCSIAVVVNSVESYWSNPRFDLISKIIPFETWRRRVTTHFHLFAPVDNF